MNFPSVQILLLAAMFGAATARGQVPVPVVPPSASQILVAQPPVDVDSPVTASATFDPAVAAPGETVFYRVDLDASAGMIQWPDKLSFPDGVRVISRASGEIMQAIAGRYRPLTSYVYELRATNAGRYSLPAFTVRVSGQPVTIPAAEFSCVRDKPASLPSAPALTLEASATNVYLGEPLTLQVQLPTLPGTSVQVVNDIQFIGDGFMSDKTSARQVIKMVEYNGRQIPAYVFAQTVTPIGAGERTLRAQGFTAGRNFNGPITITGRVVLGGGLPHYVLLLSNPVKIHVRPLPVAGRLPGFTGGIGQFICGPPQLATNRLHVGMPVELKVNVNAVGTGNANRLVPPPPPRLDDWQIIPDPDGKFSYTLIPMTDHVTATPAIPFSTFNPQSGKYTDLTIPSVPVTVAPEKLPERIPASDFAGTPPAAPALSGLADAPGRPAALKPLQLRGWFIALQLLPVLLFIDLWQWARHRRYLEAHPEIVRRRKARRALRRENARRKKAVAAGDAAGFLRHAVAALRVVCAPRYPANPQALVCADVLAQLTGPEKQGRPGETVRIIFSAADSEFSPAATAAASLLDLEPDLAAVLQQLEARL
jgi:hypothetical protein